MSKQSNDGDYADRIPPGVAIADRIDTAFESIAEWSIRGRWYIAVFTILVIAAGGYFASGIRMDNSLDNFFYKDDPAYQAYTEYLETFVSDEVAYIMYSAEGTEHGPFDLDVMRTIAELTKALENEVPFAREATSLANVEFMYPVGVDDILVDELLINFPESQQELLAVRDRVMAKPLYTGYLINPTAEYAAIILQMQATSTGTLDEIIFDKSLPPDHDNTYPVVSNNKVREILARPEFNQHGLKFYLSGDVSMNATYMVVMEEDFALITAVALAIILLVCLLLLPGGFAGMIGPIVVVITSVLLTIGLIGALDWPMGTFFAMLPTLLCAVGIAQSVHILIEYQRNLDSVESRNQAIKLALRKVGGPCLMAAVTTAAGFAVMSVSDLKMLAEFGVYASFGVLLTFILSATLLVVFLGGAKPLGEADGKAKLTKPAIHPLIRSIVDRCIHLNLQHGNKVAVVFALGFIIAFLGITQLRTDFNFLEDFKPHMQWRQDTEKIETEMGGILRMSYLIDTKVEDGVKSPALLKQIGAIQRFAEQQPLVKKTLSITDVIMDLNQTFHSGDAQYYRVPNQRDLLSQYFLLYEMSGGSELEEFVTQDFSRTVIELQLEMRYSTEIKELIGKIDDFIELNPLPNAEPRKTGIGLLWIKMGEYISATQIKSYTLVFLIIAVFMCISFGSIRVGMISMIPNLTPVVLALGVLGWLNIPLDYLKLLFATIAIGIAVDDTIHLVTRVRKRFLETGNYQQAVTLGLHDVGPALIITSIILISAFMAYLLSNTVVLASFGILLGGTIAAALAADLLLMPVLILKWKPFGPEFSREAA